MTDSEARRRIREDLDTTFLVEAGAGSGKTHSLVERMVALLAAGRCPIGGLAAVTFTRKAAAEMRGRFQMRLEQSVRDGVRDRRAGETWTPEERGRLAEALRYLERAFVGTIHAFCATLLRERPVEAGVDPDFEEIDGLDDRLFRDRCWHEALDEARARGSGRLDDLDEVGLAPDDLRDAFDVLCAYSEVRPVPGLGRASESAPESGRPFDPANLRRAIEEFRTRAQDLRGKFASFLDGAGALLPPRCPKGGWDDYQWKLLRAARRRRTFDDLRDVGDLMATVEAFEGDPDAKPKAVARKWGSAEAVKAAAALLQGFRRRLAPDLRAWRELRHDAALAFLLPVREAFDRRRRDEGRLNFQDLLTLAADMLRRHPDVRRHFRERFPRILVDEFQDTDPLQAEILFYIAGEDMEEKAWRRLALRPGALFLVGDPKQSIYRFRRADIDVYNRVKESVEHGGGEVLRLTTNFRALDCLAGWINPIFRTEFGDGSEFQAAFAPLETVRGACTEARRGVFTVTLPQAPRHKAEVVAEADARAIGNWIAWALSRADKSGRAPTRLRLTGESGGIGAGTDGLGPPPRDAEPGDFLLLFRYRKHMDLYARELEKHGVPYEISGSDVFGDAEEVRAIADLLRLLADPENEVRTAGALRGLFFGCSDQDLLDYADAGGKFRMDAPEPAAAAAAGPAGASDPSAGRGIRRVAQSLAQLRLWRDAAKALPPSAALARILEDSGLVARLAAGEMGNSRAGSVFKLLDVLRRAEVEGGGSLAEAALRIEEILEHGDIEEMSLTPGRTRAVRLMNLHRAKGLEAPVVFLANPIGHKAGFDPHVHVRREQPAAEAPGPRSGHDRPGDGGGPARGEGFFRFTRKLGQASKVLSQPEGWAEVEKAEKEYGCAEERRLMYVAATRARDLLVISLYEGWLEDTADEADEGEESPRDIGKDCSGRGAEETRERLEEETRLLAEKKLAKQSWGILNKPAKDLPPLEGPDRDIEPPARENLVLKKREREWAAETRLAAYEEIRLPTHRLETVTSIAEAERARASWGSGGFGLKWGTAVHGLLDNLGRAAERGGQARLAAVDLDALVRGAVNAAEMPESDAPRVAGLLRSILGSEFWGRVLKARRRLFETPFAVHVSPGDPDYDRLARSEPDGSKAGLPETGQGGAKPRMPANIPILLSGAIDLAFLEDGGWVIADYKTDFIDVAAGSDAVRAALRDLVDHYRPQVELYSRFWERTTGDRVKETGLFFTSLGYWHRIECF